MSSSMAVTPGILLAKMQGLNISTEVIDHPAVLTVEVRLCPDTDVYRHGEGIALFTPLQLSVCTDCRKPTNILVKTQE